jgi:hypothetical protein
MSTSPSRRRPALLLAAALVALPVTARASPLFEITGGGRFTTRVSGTGAATTYFNPALLGHARQSLELGWLVFSDQIGIRVDARDDAAQCTRDPGTGVNGCDILEVHGAGPESFQHEAGQRIANPTLPTDWLANGRGDGLAPRPRQAAAKTKSVLAYQVLGLVNPIVRDRLVLGFYAFIPLSELTTAQAFYSDEREQFFSNSLHPELYADRLTATSLAFGAGSRLTDKLAAGVSFTLSLKNIAKTPVYVTNINDLDTLLLDSDIGVKAAVAPHFGVVYDPIERLRLAATVHSRQAFEIEAGFDYLISSGTEQGTTMRFTHAYMPWTFVVGGQLGLGAPGGHELALAGTAQYALWSRYRDRHDQTPHPAYAWSDTFAASLGFDHRRGALHSTLDLTFQPSPVPPQTGRTNYVDNDRLGVAAGVGYEFRAWGSRFRAGAQTQVHRLLAEHVVKVATPANPQPNPNLPGFEDGHRPELVQDEVPDDVVDFIGDPIPNREGLQTNNPGFPGYASDGWLLAGTLTLTLLY